MKVLALVTDAFGGYGGIAQYNRDFLAAVAATPGVSRVDVLPRLAPEALGDLPPGVRQQRAISNKFAYAAAAFAAASRMKPDLVFSGHLYHGPLAAMVARLSDARLVSQLHGTEVWTAFRARDRKPIVGSDLVLAVSRDTLRRAQQQAGGAVRGEVLPNTVGPQFHPGDRAVARARFGLSACEQVLLTVARLDGRNGYKGHDRIIRLLSTLRADGRNVVYLVAGVGEDRERLERLAADAGVADFTRFLGKVPDADLPDLYRAADLFVLPSTGEGFGIVFLEAMACGAPALGLHAGGVPDALCDGELGWCIDPEDDLGTAVARALDAPRPDAGALHAAVHARFGQEAFRARVADILGGLQ